MLVSRLHVPCKVQLNYDFVTAAAAAALSFCAFSSFPSVVVVVLVSQQSECMCMCRQLHMHNRETKRRCPFRNSRAQFHSRITPPPPRSEISDFSRTTQWKSMRATAPDLRQCAHVPRCELASEMHHAVRAAVFSHECNSKKPESSHFLARRSARTCRATRSKAPLQSHK
jgi:hypothetical protein